MAFINKHEIVHALKQLGELAKQQEQSIELLVVGGTAMVLLFDIRPSTRDIDVLILSPEASIVRSLAKQVAQEVNLPDDWLNDAAKGYLIGMSRGSVLLETPGIRVVSPSIAQLLAMKLSAWRDDVDINDARHLLQTLGGSQPHVWESIQPYLIPGAELKAEYAFLDLWEALYGKD
jgi:hypothetical protein